MQTERSISWVLDEVRMNVLNHELSFRVHTKGDGFLLQVVGYNITDNVTGHKSTQKGGKYYISSHATDTEVVMTAWKACQDFLIHEAREGFKFKQQAIFGPHFDANWLAAFAERAPESIREEPNG